MYRQRYHTPANLWPWECFFTFAIHPPCVLSTHGGEKYTQTLRWWDKFLAITLPKTNIAPENGWLEDEMSYWEGLFSGSVMGEKKTNQTCHVFFFSLCQKKWVPQVLWKILLKMGSSSPIFGVNIENIWVFPKIGVPQNGWFIMENPI